MTTDLRRIILDTTRHMLIEEGFNNLSMRKIASKTGYSATSIYLHFKNKDDLFHALIEEGYEYLYQTFTSIDQDQEDPLKCLRAFCQTYLQFGLENSEYYEIMFMLHPEQLARYPAEKFRRARRTLDILAEVLDRGNEQGVFILKDPRVSASAVWATLHGFVSLMIAQRVDVRIDREDFIQAALHHVIRSVHADTALP